MAKKIEGYFVCTSGVIWTVFSYNGALSTNMNAEIDIVDSKYNTYKEVQILVNEGDEKLVEEEFQLWDSLVELAKAIEE